MYQGSKAIVSFDNVLYMTNMMHYKKLIDDGWDKSFDNIRKTMAEIIECPEGNIMNLYDFESSGMNIGDFMGIRTTKDFYNDLSMVAQDTIRWLSILQQRKVVSQVIITETIPVQSVRDNIILLMRTLFIPGTKLSFRFFNTDNEKHLFIRNNSGPGDVVVTQTPSLIDKLLENIHTIKHSLFIPSWGWTERFMKDVTTNNDKTDVVVRMMMGWQYLEDVKVLDIDEQLADIMK